MYWTVVSQLQLISGVQSTDLCSLLKLVLQEKSA